MADLTWANTQITIETDNQLRRAAADLRISRSELIRLAIQAFLAQENMVAHTAEIIKSVEAVHGNAG